MIVLCVSSESQAQLIFLLRESARIGITFVDDELYPALPQIIILGLSRVMGSDLP